MLSVQDDLKEKVAAGLIDQLRSQVKGDVIAPTDPQYDERRKAWNLRVVQHPALIVIARDAQDVVAAVCFAGEQGLGIAVQSGGHGVIRPADGALLIVTSELRDMQVDAASRTAWIGAGLKWGLVLEETQAFGLAPLLGSSPDVGVVGYTLGGGIGWLARRYGMALDSVFSIEVVTADGQLCRTSHTENADLFWGLRGGGGAFGVVTGMEIKLYPVSTIYAGNLIYPVERAKEVYSRYREWIKTAPDELTSSIVLMNYPPIPEIPEFLRGKSFVMVRGCYCGPSEEGEGLLRYWRDWQAPFIDDFKAIPFSEVATVSNDPVNPLPGMSTGAWLSELSDDAIDILIRYGAAKDGPSPLIVTEVRHAGGAIARVEPGANAYGHRAAELVLNLIGMTPTPEAYRHLVAYSTEFKRLLEPCMTGGVYMNFLEGEESQQRIRDAYSPETYQRLAALKAKYDPHNLFSYSFNI
jgi:hypothetical protein